MIIEYLLISAVAIGVIMAVSTAVGSKTLGVAMGEINRVNDIPDR